MLLLVLSGTVSGLDFLFLSDWVNVQVVWSHVWYDLSGSVLGGPVCPDHFQVGWCRPHLDWELHIGTFLGFLTRWTL